MALPLSKNPPLTKLQMIRSLMCPSSLLEKFPQPFLCSGCWCSADNPEYCHDWGQVPGLPLETIYFSQKRNMSDIFALATSWFRKLGSPSWVKRKLMGRRGGIKWTLYPPYRVGRGRCTYFGFLTRGSFRQIKLLSKEFTELWALCGRIHSYFIFGEVNWGVAAKGVNHSHF